MRLPDDLARAIDQAVAERGYNSPSAFIRHAIQKELRQGDAVIAEVEERIAATLHRFARDLRAASTRLNWLRSPSLMR